MAGWLRLPTNVTGFSLCLKALPGVLARLHTRLMEGEMNDMMVRELNRTKALEYQAEAQRNRLLAERSKQGPRVMLARSLVRLAHWLSPATDTHGSLPAPQRRVRL